MSKIVIALGGNALGNSYAEQLEIVKDTAVALVDIVTEGHELIIVHGNGPQVGMIQKGLDSPLPESGAMSQGYIGYHLQNAIQNELRKRNVEKNCVTVVTQMLVDKDDEAFKNPTKPVGQFYTQEESIRFEKEFGYVMKEDSGRGFRRVVASPLPKRIIEEESISKLVDNGEIVICCGGGGIPVIDEDGIITGVPAVIDKDFASALLATTFNADYLVILTAVDQVSINFNTPLEKAISEISVEDGLNYANSGEFGEGSMKPKVLACIEFVKNGNGVAKIASLEKAIDALNGLSGTTIVK